MTTPIVQSISNEQLAELDELTAKLVGEDWWVDWGGSYTVMVSPSNIQSLIARLRAAEADAKRYRWIRKPYQDVSLVLDKVSGEVPADEFGRGGYLTYEYRSGDELDAAIDAAMERTP
ncbi:TPA: hypothetical protein ACRMOY_003397 [Pseudomonas aeruginosa]|uniref:hypothetical protein n=1 Tax=Pseudomonas aeruginosa TaxID=287 RepID=UPI00249F2C85|nr:hypothetical protein [Pseudomonas aeruginosa]EIW4149150.1 hypothetical protein [Pseudomonas aeruginosa]EKU5852394.1 hypothetical protein [Pseudomonas aeruginosa]WGX57588.1 hypothetical protein P7I93_11850 [Pseudomonas aeruginosa]HCF1405881.1 hypothetical protein [Pseudomonas aeruginosa]